MGKLCKKLQLARCCSSQHDRILSLTLEVWPRQKTDLGGIVAQELKGQIIKISFFVCENNYQEL